LSFGPEFTSAVELKQVAQQDAEKQRFLVEKVIAFDRVRLSWSLVLRFRKAEQSRQANVIAAEGDARAADLIGKALGEAGDGKVLDLDFCLITHSFSCRPDRTATYRSCGRYCRSISSFTKHRLLTPRSSDVAEHLGCRSIKRFVFAHYNLGKR
jgi:hypothetical protein